MNTTKLITSLTDTHTSDFNRAEALATLIKHNYYVSIRDDLRMCYIEEDYTKAKLLIEATNKTNNIQVKQGKTIYTMKNKIAKQKTDSRQTLGIQITAVGGNSGWAEAMDIMERLNTIKEIETNPNYLNRSNRLRKILKRKARLSKVRVSKKGNATKYKRRELPTIPTAI